jgi:hypothetical protein
MSLEMAHRAADRSSAFGELRLWGGPGCAKEIVLPGWRSQKVQTSRPKGGRPALICFVANGRFLASSRASRTQVRGNRIAIEAQADRNLSASATYCEITEFIFRQMMCWRM